MSLHICWIFLWLIRILIMKRNAAVSSDVYIKQRLQNVFEEQFARNAQVKLLVLPVDALG